MKRTVVFCISHFDVYLIAFTGAIFQYNIDINLSDLPNMILYYSIHYTYMQQT